MASFRFVLIFIIACCAVRGATATEFPALQAIFSFFGTESKVKDIANMTLEELGQSRGNCNYDFVDLALYRDRWTCAPDDHFIAHLLNAQNNEATRKPPIMVKCLQPEPSENATVTENVLQVMGSVKDIVTLLKPVGNSTKRHEPGSCVLVLFYTESSLGCAHVAPYANSLPRRFPTLRIAAIDAFKFPSFNTEFGVVGLPTLLLFHQGRPVVKFYSDVGTFASFVTRHTGIKPIDPGTKSPDIYGPLPLEPKVETDYWLLVAWAFIAACAAKYFAKSRLYKQILDVIKRNWLEAQLERN